MKRNPVPLFALLLAAACGSTNKVDMREARRVVGTESAVRIDAQITDDVAAGSPLAITYQITNQRTEPIAIADIVPETTWDDETRTLTVGIGSEVPGQSALPRLIRVAPGETKSFSTTARVNRVIPRSSSPNPGVVEATLLRLKVNFLGDTKPFAELIDIPEKAVIDSKRADELFATWLERNEVVYTNAVPVKLGSARQVGNETGIERPVIGVGRRGRRG
ncbi:MAG TPA: hypothetical protein VND45_05675 [Thermoanaerobaculia bacterium]|nr:hypothetical protein [Thermoanaerobaculia bacterium]